MAIPKPIAAVEHLCRCPVDHCWDTEQPIPLQRFNITCPNCGSTSDHLRRKLWNKQRHKWLPIPCNTCKQKSASSKWECECGILWHKCTIHRPQGMRCINPKAAAGALKRKNATPETVTKRRKTVAVNDANAPTLKCKTQVRPQPKVVKQGPDWVDAAERLNRELNSTALQVRPMPADGNCFYHAIADRLGELGHSYTYSQLKQMAGAGHGDEAEEQHIEFLVAQPVPLYVRFVPVDIAAAKLTLNWEAAMSMGNPSAPALSLIRWTKNGHGKHFDILEYKKNIDAKKARTSLLTSKSCTSRAVTQKPRGNKRDAKPPTNIRKLFKLEGGRIVRLRDQLDCSKINRSEPT